MRKNCLKTLSKGLSYTIDMGTITKKNDSKMQTVVTTLLTAAKQHGLSMVLLVLAVWWMNQKNEALSKKVDLCNQETIDIYKNQNEELLKVVEQNTRAIENFSFFLKEHK